MEFEVPVTVGASAGKVWDVLVDVEAWPEWTASMKKVQRLDGGPFQVGSRARIWQPRLPSMVWVVTAFDEGRSFTWEASRPGSRVVAGHQLSPAPDDGSAVVLTIRSSGWAARAIEPFTGSMMRRNVGMEATGLKARAESRS